MRWESGIAILGIVGVLAGAGAAAPAARNGVHACRPVYQHFHSRPDLHPAGICVGRHAGRVGTGLLVITASAGPRNARGPELLDSKGNLIWMDPDNWASDLEVATFRGRPVLTWWDGHVGANGHPGQYVLMSDHYRVIGHVAAGGSLDTDMHDLSLTPQGTAIVGSHPIYRDRRTGKTVSGDYVITELDPSTGHVVFQWRARDHIPLSATYRPMPRDSKTGWDAYHGNSIQVTHDGNLLVSMRNTSAIYKVSRRTGRIIWTLGGRRDSFDLVSHHRLWQFCHQHDARELSSGHILLFDNGGNYADRGCPHHLARVEEFALNVHRHTVRLVRELSSRAASPDGKGYVSWFVGSARRLRNHDTLVDWGSVPVIDEFDRGGRVVFDMRLGSWTYRALRANWVGKPLDPPAIATQRDGHRLTVWASWNGATKVASWRLLTGPSATSLTPREPAQRRTGFETRLTTTAAGGAVAVEALDAGGHVLGTSEPVAVR